MSEAQFVWPEYEIIKSPEVLRTWLLRLGKAVREGHLVQHDSDEFDIAKYTRGDPWPSDIIICNFKYLGHSYRLSADTYHGTGGTWEKTS